MHVSMCVLAMVVRVMCLMMGWMQMIVMLLVMVVMMMVMVMLLVLLVNMVDLNGNTLIRPDIYASFFTSVCITQTQ